VSENQRSPTIGQVFARHREVTKRQIRVAMPAQVLAFDPATQTVDVQPLVDDQTQQEDGTFEPLPFPVLTHVPVGFMAAGGFRITLPVTAGDTGQVVVNDLSLDLWKQQGGHVTPKEQRRHHIADATFYPGMHPDNASWTGVSASGVTIGKDGGPQIVLRAGTIEFGGSDLAPPADFVALASLVIANLTALKSAINGWTPVPNDGGAALKVALSALFAAPWPTSVGSAILKAE
jgi:hypothetical protein